MAPSHSNPIELSVVVPMLNEESALGGFFATVTPILEGITANYEIVCIDDGSQDRTYEILGEMRDSDPRIKVIRLSRNFGKEAALTAGLTYAVGEAVVPMDADLQDPPEIVPDMVDRWRAGADVVVAKRIERTGDTLLKKKSAGMFYRYLNRISAIEIPENVGDFRLMDRRVVDAVGQFTERNRFMKGIFASLGFSTDVVEFDRPGRADGTPKQDFRRLFALAVDGFVSFSAVPLKIWSYLGLIIAALSMVYGIYIVIDTLIFGIDVPGYASLLAVILFMNGLILISLGVIGEYLARMFTEVKSRPIYIVRESQGFEQDPVRSAGAAE